MFTKGYFKLLAVKLAKYGIEPQKLIDAVWTGTAAMVKNDGGASNEDRFWQKFTEITGFDKAKVNKDCLDFYANEFNGAKNIQMKIRWPKRRWRLQERKVNLLCLRQIRFFRLSDRIQDFIGSGFPKKLLTS